MSFSGDIADPSFLRSIEAVIKSTRRTPGLLLAASGRRPVAIPLPPTHTEAVGASGGERSESTELDRAVGAFRDWWRETRECDGSGEAPTRGTETAHPRSTSRSVTGWSSLTDGEVRVAELVSLGLTNREIGRQMYLSRFTIDRHLRHVFDKLGIGSRAQLAGAAVAHLPVNGIQNEHL